MNGHNHEPKKIVERLLLISAVLATAVIVFLDFLLFGPPSNALQLLLPGVLASLLAVLLIYILRQILFRSTNTFLTDSEISYLSSRIAEELKGNFPFSSGITFYEKWNEVPWKEVLGEAQELEFYASYMDTWIIQTTDLLLAIFNRGGTIRVFLPKPGSIAAKRVVDRFPEYSDELITAKIESTVYKLQMFLKRSINKRAKLDVYWTETFCMHCLLLVDKKRLILSPFDHFRQGQIDAPATVIELDRYPRVAEWATKEIRGFERSSKRLNTPLSTTSVQTQPLKDNIE